MGGILIVLAMDITAILWAQWNTLVQLTLLSVLVFAGLGFYDDYAKITKQTNVGAAARIKLSVQGALGLFIAIYLLSIPATAKLIREVMVPFYKYPIATSATLGILITVLTIVGSSNAVNLTDGLDGLAIGCTVIVSSVFFIVTYLSGNAVMAKYLQIPHVVGADELSVFCAAMIGAGLGFLGSTVIPPESSWATLARLHSVARWESSQC
jgi:phospho-N-acetylmuramoyl-pentapeptide-transferase